MGSANPRTFAAIDAHAIVVGKVKVGSTVRLKSGGPNMTVARLFSQPSGGREMAECCWFDNAVQIVAANFPLECLNCW